MKTKKGRSPSKRTGAAKAKAPAKPIDLAPTPAQPITPAQLPPPILAPPPTRDELVAQHDEAIERTQQCRIDLRMAERAMLDARKAIERFDELASRPAPPVHRR